MQTVSAPAIGAVEPVRRRVEPVKVWAVVGAGFLALGVYVLGSWILSGPEPTRTGPNSQPYWEKVVIHSAEAILCVALVVFLVKFLLRPWRREGRISFEGMFCLAFPLLWWQDPLMSYIVPQYTYNTAAVNFGSFATKIPGWTAPRMDRLAEPILWEWTSYVPYFLGVSLLGCWMLRRLKAQYPTASPFRIFVTGYALVFAVDLFTEYSLIRLRLWTYSGWMPFGTLHYGEPYQVPLIEIMMAAGLLMGFVTLHYFRNDKGESWAERGLTSLRIGSRGKQWMRFLAISGALQTIYLAYSIIVAFCGIWGGAWPDYVVDRPYLNDGICGRGSGHACPTTDSPMPRRSGPYINENGELVR